MSETYGLLRRPGESPPLSALAAQADAYFSGHLADREVDEVQEKLARNPDFAAELLNWYRFSSPAPQLVPPATLAAWQQEDETRLRTAIAEEQAAREEAARLIGISVDDLGRIPPPPPPSYGAEEEARARRAIERLKPLSAAEQIELVRQEPAELGGEAVASACLVEARAALPASPEDSGAWADVACLATEPLLQGTGLVLRLRAECYKGNALRCLGNFGSANEIIFHAIHAARDSELTDARLWAEASRFRGSIERVCSDFEEALRSSRVALVLWEYSEDVEEQLKTRWHLAYIHGEAGSLVSALQEINQAITIAKDIGEPGLIFPLQHERVTCLARAGRYAEARDAFAAIQTAYREYPAWEPRGLALQALIAAGLGSDSEGEAYFNRARDLFLTRKRPWDAALITLDWALLLLQRNRVDEVAPLAISMGQTFEALGIARETLASWAILREAAERRELTQAVIRQVHEELSRPGAFRQAVGDSPGEALAKPKLFEHDLNRSPSEPRAMKPPDRFSPRADREPSAAIPAEQSAAYFAGGLAESEVEALQERLAQEPDVAEALLDWHRFSPPTADSVAPDTLSSWMSEDRARLAAAIAAEQVSASQGSVVPFIPKTAPRTRLTWKVLAATAGLAASLTGVAFVTAPVAETFIVPASTQRGDDDLTTVTLGRWPHKVRFQIDARTLGEIDSPRVLLLDSMTDALVASTRPETHDDSLWASFWGIDPGNYRLEIEDTAAGRHRPVANHPVEILAPGSGP